MPVTLAPLPPGFTTTKDGLHALAEHVLAPLRYGTDGHIGLRARSGGFGPPPRPDGRTVTAIGDRVHDGDRSTPVTTLAEVAAFLGVAVGAPAGVYTPVTDADPDRPLGIDRAAAEALGTWFAFGDEVLEAARAEAGPGDSPSEVQLWPEHFDLGTDLGPDGARANLGASPGDEGHPEPYLYIGPWEPRTGDFWNESFGASLSYRELLDGADPLDFIRRGRALLG